jgi:hypothetical protein
MSLDKKIEEQLIDFPKMYDINCQECKGKIEYLGQIRDQEGEYNFRYEYVCNDCGLITNYRELIDELQSKWPYNVIFKKNR